MLQGLQAAIQHEPAWFSSDDGLASRPVCLSRKRAFLATGQRQQLVAACIKVFLDFP
jgi:hypothetical protein